MEKKPYWLRYGASFMPKKHMVAVNASSNTTYPIFDHAPATSLTRANSAMKIAVMRSDPPISVTLISTFN